MRHGGNLMKTTMRLLSGALLLASAAIAAANVGPTSVLYAVELEENYDPATGTYTSGLDRIQGGAILSNTNTGNPIDSANRGGWRCAHNGRR
ncbi:MAG: hypothetical protein JSS72_00755 [Armatimonadetes bacterium]|nr:hypothetical protein [Armatimonadota bacterium]